MRAVVVCLLFAAACGTAQTRTSDGGNQQTICPAHPENCAGKCCGTECLDVTNDPRNCGDCNQQCSTGTICFGGHCGCPPNGLACGMGQTCCGSLGCVSLDSDIRNCGACGNQCGDGATCDKGVCHCGGVTCNGGQTCCNGACAPGCGSSMPGPDMAMMSGGPPPGFCSCSDKCAKTLTHQCVDTNCCWENAFIFMTCNPTGSCAPFTYQ